MARAEICSRIDLLGHRSGAASEVAFCDKLAADLEQKSKPLFRSTGFLDSDVGGGYLANAYELKVRLDHTLARMQLLLAAAGTIPQGDS